MSRSESLIEISTVPFWMKKIDLLSWLFSARLSWMITSSGAITINILIYSIQLYSFNRNDSLWIRSSEKFSSNCATFLMIFP